MISVCLVRGKYLNNFETQSYPIGKPGILITGVSTLFPLGNDFPFPVIRLPSPSDLDILSLPVKYVGNRLLGDSQMLVGLENLAGKFDIFHTADPHYYYSYQLARLRSRNLIRNLLVTSWETIPFNNETVGKKRQIKRFTLKHADRFLVYTERAGDALIREGVIEKKIDLVRLGIDLQRFKPARPNQGEKNGMTILFAGRLVEEKGILDLYEVYREIRKSLPAQAGKGKGQSDNLKLKIVGGGNLKSSLLNRIKTDGLEGEVTVEQISYREIPEIYRRADIFVLPSKTTKTWEEQYGMVLLEAMASGLPVVAYGSGSIPEVLGGAGLLVPEGNKNQLSSSIKHLIESRSERLKLGRMGREKMEKHFDASKTSTKLVEIYRKLVVSA